MASGATLGINRNIVPLKAPVDSAGTAYATTFVNAATAVRAEFFAYFGVISAASADQAIIVTMEASTTSASGSEVQIPFKYRVSAATGTNTWGAITSATASGGATIATTDDGKMLQVYVDLAGLDALLADAKWLRMVVGIDAGGTATLNAVWAEIDPHYGSLVNATTAS